MPAPSPTAAAVTSTSATAALSDDEVREILSGWKELKSEHIDMYVSSGIGKILIRLQRSGFKCTEGDPLLLLCPDPQSHEASMAYLHGGNFNLPQGTPGQRPWPTGVAPANGTGRDRLPAGVDASPPFALGRFILEQFPQTRDETEGTSLSVIYVPSLAVVSAINTALVNSPQFQRVAPGLAARLNIDPEPSLVRAFLLDRLDGPPQSHNSFTY